MVRISLLIILLMAVLFRAESQNRTIEFEHGPEWKKMLKQAKKQNKLIFVDCYTSWCGPCKMLLKNVFTLDSVADFFNKSFVNVKYDMEKDADGVALKQPFGIKAYPTLLFVDPVTEKVVHQMVGAGEPDWLLAGAREAMDPQNNLAGLAKRYADGERGSEFLGKYLECLASAYLQEDQNKVASEYLSSLAVDQLATEENWKLLKENINDPLSIPLRNVVDNQAKFDKIAGKEVVEAKIRESVLNAVGMLAGWNEKSPKPFDENRNKEMIEWLQSVDYDFVPGSLARLYAAELIRKKDFRGMMDQMREVLRYKMFRHKGDQWYFQHNVEALQQADDENIIREGIAWIDDLDKASQDYFFKSSLMDSKVRLLKRLGDTAGAEKAEADAKAYNEVSAKKTGMMKAIRMN